MVCSRHRNNLIGTVGLGIYSGYAINRPIYRIDKINPGSIYGRNNTTINYLSIPSYNKTGLVLSPIPTREETIFDYKSTISIQNQEKYHINPIQTDTRRSTVMDSPATEEVTNTRHPTIINMNSDNDIELNEKVLQAASFLSLVPPLYIQENKLKDTEKKLSDKRKNLVKIILQELEEIDKEEQKSKLKLENL